MNKIIKQIPNLITCLNVLSGCVATVMAFQGSMRLALMWIVIAAVFDFLDGLAARVLGAYSKMGKELDSLADIISFGMAPGVMLYSLLQSSASFFIGLPTWLMIIVPYAAFVIPILSAVRLAKFNVDERQTISFIGLPVPAHALLWSSLVVELEPYMALWNGGLWVLLPVVALLSSTLLISEMPMFSLKIKSITLKGNELPMMLILSAILFILFWGILGITMTIVFYVILSVLFRRSSGITTG